MTPWQPRYQGGEIPAVAATAIAPGTFVLLTGANTQSGEYQVEPCGLGQTPFGVAVTGVSESRLAGRDPTSVELRVQVYRGRGVARVVPGAAISGPGVGIQSDGFGRAIPAGPQWPHRSSPVAPRTAWSGRPSLPARRQLDHGRDHEPGWHRRRRGRDGRVERDQRRGPHLGRRP